MARMSIYVPDDLKTRMDAVDSVNWSAVAQSQFERELRLHTKLTGDEMQATIERLKASKAAQTDEAIADGVEAGKQWAKGFAEYAQLKKVSEAYAEMRPQDISIPRILQDGDFWTDFFPEGLPDALIESDGEFNGAFAAGASEVWEQVKDELA